MKHSIFSRKRLINEAEKVKKWDLIIIGGGATGLGIALDSVTRGYKTLLLEQVDFAKGTSSRSTKLVHGGIRYLAQGNIDLVREALHERGLLAKNAPHLVKKQNFIIPNYLWWEGLYYNFGLKTYDFLAGKLSMGKSERLSTEEVVHRIPSLIKEDLRGGVIYLDGQFDDARLAVNIAQTCVENGGVALNHFKVHGISAEEDTVNTVKAKDTETGTTYDFKAKLVVNATGVFVDYIRKMANPEAKSMIRASQGVHLVFDKKFFPGEDALMIPKTDDGRVLFAVPWNRKVLVGTTDTLLEKPELEPKALEQEIDFIINTFNKYIKEKVTRPDVKSVFAGLRPLAAGSDEEGKSTKEISRGHKIEFSNLGLLTITGGKWTTYRKMAEDTLDYAIEHKRLPPRKCITENFLIHGSKSHKNRDNHLHIYGSDKSLIQDLIAEEPELGKKIHQDLPYLKAEVVWAVKYEMARTLEDVLARRVRMLFLDSAAAYDVAPEVAGLIAKELEKDDKWIETQVEQFRNLIKNHYQIDLEETSIDRNKKQE